MSKVGWADIGSAHLRGSRVDDVVDRSSFGARRAPASVGWTAPTYVYDLMRRIDADATDLDTSMRSYVADQAVVTAWKRWLDEWRAFFKAKMAFGAKLGAAFDTEGLQNTTNGYASDLQGWHLKYAAQRTSLGEPVPPPATPGGVAPFPRDVPGGESDGKTGWSGILGAIPWWVYVLGVGTLGAVGYSFYKAAQQAQADKNYLFHNVVPALIPHVPSPPMSTSGDFPSPPML